MKDTDARRPLSLALVLALVAAPWPAWSQVARISVGAPSSRATAVHAANAAPASALAAAPLSSPAGLAPALAAPAFAPSAAASRQAAPSLALPVAAALAAGAPSDAGAAADAPAPSASAPSAAPAAAAEADVRGKTVVLVGTKGSRPFIMQEAARIARELGLNLVLVDDPANRANSAEFVPDSHFIPAPINARGAKSREKIAEAVAAHPVASQAYAVTGFMSLYAKLTGRITDRLGAKGIPGWSVAAADDKPEARKLLNKVPGLEVPFKEIKSAADARAAYHEVSGGGRYKVVLKTIRGENSRFLALGIASEEAAAAEYLKMDAAVKDFVSRPEAKQTTFSTHPGIMMERMLEKVPGTEETSVEVVMQDGKAAFAIVSDTRGIGEKGQLAGGIMVFPSQQPQAEHAALIEAAERALVALGILNGNARLDMMTTPDGPRVIEINPFMGGVAIWSAVKSLTGMSLVEQGLRAVLGLKVDPGHAPDGVLHYIFLASRHSGKVEEVRGVEAARKLPGVELARSFVEPGDGITAAKGNAYEEWAEVIGKGATWRDAIRAARAAARRMMLRVRLADGSTAVARGDYQQPTIEDLTGEAKASAPVAPSAAAAPAVPAQTPPGLFSKVVVGFLSTFMLVSTVVESTSLAVSQMTQPLTQGFLALAALTSVSYMAYTLGSHFGGGWVKKYGIRLSYRTVLLARAAVWTAMAAIFFSSGGIPLALLVPLFSLDYFFHAIGRVAEHSLQVAWFKNSEVASSRFGSFRDFIEYATIFIGSAMALVVASLGFGAVIYPAPFAFALAALVALRLNLPGPTPVAAEKTHWSEGFKTVLKDSKILKPLLGFALVNSFLYMMYYITATAFGAYAAPTPEQAAGVAGALTAVYGVGALAGSVFMDRLAARISKKVEALPETERKAGEKRLYALSAARVLPWAAAALLGSWAFLSSVQIGSLLWPIFPISIALLGIGFTGQLASNHLDTIMKSNIPSDKKDQSVGAIRALIYLSHVVGFALWGGLFAAFGTGAFALFAGFYTLAALAYLWMARDLKKQAGGA